MCELRLLLECNRYGKEGNHVVAEHPFVIAAGYFIETLGTNTRLRTHIDCESHW